MSPTPQERTVIKFPSKTKARRALLATGATVLVIASLSERARAILVLVVILAILWRVGPAMRRMLKGKPAARKTKRPAVKKIVVPPNAATDAQATAAVIRALLKAKTGRAWSVSAPAKGPKVGTIVITVPPIRRETGGLGIIDQAALTRLLGTQVPADGHTIPATQAARTAALVALQKARSLA